MHDDRVNMLIPPDVLERVLGRALSKGGEFADVFAEVRRPAHVVLEDGRIEKVVSGTDSGVGIRVIFGFKTAYAIVGGFGEDELMGAASTLAAAVAADRAGLAAVVPSVIKAPQMGGFNVMRHPDAVSMDERVELARGADGAARDAAPSDVIRQVSVICRDASQVVQVANSQGVHVFDSRVQTTGIVQVVAAKAEAVQTGYETVGGHMGFEVFSDDALQKAAREAARRAVAMLGAPRAKGGRMPVVISSEAGGTMIHEAIGHGLEADLANQGLSRFGGKVGQLVASGLVTVIDDATLEGRRGSFSFDDEGTPAQRTVLVEDGVLKTYMYDRLSAMRAGCGSTGNGRRESYRHKPIPRMTNTFIAPGKSSPEDIISSTKTGLLVKKMGGGQVNTVNGDFVFDVTEGYMIENGRPGQMVRGATLTGNGPEVLMSIDMVGTDLGFAIGTCGKDSQGAPVSDAMPTLRIPDIVVGGEA